MSSSTAWTRRHFVRDVARAGMAACVASGAARVAGGAAFRNAFPESDRSRVFRVNACPVHDNSLRHVGVDTLFDLLADNGLKLYRSAQPHRWAGPQGLVDRNDVVLIKVNCQWRCRGATNTDVVRGVIHRLLRHPDGFGGEVVIFENGQGRGGFDGITNGGTNYDAYPELDGVIAVNAEQQNWLSVDNLVNVVFAGQPVSSVLLDGVRGTFIGGSNHAANGYRKYTPPDSSPLVSYPCFTTARGNRIELREGRWTGSGYDGAVKTINIPVLKHHGGSGMTGALKHYYGVMSMSDGTAANRHYADIGSQLGKMWCHVRVPDLNILDCIWVSHQALRGYPVNQTRRCDVLLAGLDPVALDYYASKHVLLPLGGNKASEHDPDTFDGLKNLLLTQAQTYINAHCGIGGEPTRVGDANIEVIARAARPLNQPAWLVF